MKLLKKLGPGSRLQILAGFSILSSACVSALAAGDDAQLLSVAVPSGTQIMPRTVFIQTWNFKNTGTNTWTPGQSGYTLNIIGRDNLAATRLVPNSVSSAYHPSATISSGHSVPPGGTASFSMSFVAPELPGLVTDTFQLNSASSVYFGPQVAASINVLHAGSTNQYDRARAVSYANNYAGIVCSDGYFWTNSSSYGTYTNGAPVPKYPIGDDCAHFVSCCIGTQSTANRGGGLKIPSRTATYGEPGAGRLVNTVLIGGGYAIEVPSVSMLSPGDVIGWNWGGDSNIQNLDHVVLYVGNGLVASHAASCLDVSATTWYQSSQPNWRAHYIHILDAPTLAVSKAANKLVLSWGTNWTGYALYSCTSGAPDATWSKVATTPKIVGHSNFVTNNINSSAIFYRLTLPGT